MTARNGPWRFRSRQSGYERICPLVAYWEADHDPISDDFAPDDTAAGALLALWAKKVGKARPNGLVPIYWFVTNEWYGVTGGVFERAPFQPNGAGDRDFLHYFTWPEHAEAGTRLDWLRLPVVTKRWVRGRGDKGGFIQEATGWKPAILQPFVYLPTLLGSRPP